MPDGWIIDGSIDELCWQIEEGTAAEKFAQLQAVNLQRLRELAVDVLPLLSQGIPLISA